MSRKTILILVAIVLISLGVWIYFSATNSQNTTSSDGASKNLLSSLFPFGTNTINPPGGAGTNSGTSSVSTNDATSPSAPNRLTQISSRLVAGFTVLPTDTTPLVIHDVGAGSNSQIVQTILPGVRFAEKGTGYIYNIDVKGQNEKKVSGTVIARTAFALFANNGATAILRYVKADNATIATFLGHLVPPTDTLSAGTLEGNFLLDNISDITISHDQKSILYLIPTDGGVAGISSKTDGSAKKQLFSSSFGEWLLDWISGTPVLTTKASATVPGYSYTVNTSGIFQKNIGGVNGLTTKMSPDGVYMLYSVSGGNGVDLHLYRLKDGVDMNIGLSTLPEKCVWGIDPANFYCAAGETVPQAAYPDSWYQGVSHFNDAFWKVATADGMTTRINDGEGDFLDATNLMFDQKGQYLTFINKNDDSLWSLAL